MSARWGSPLLLFFVVSSGSALLTLACGRAYSANDPLDLEDAPSGKQKDGGSSGNPPDPPPPGDGGQTCVGPCIVEVSLGGSFGCALADDKLVRCWGENDKGQTGMPAGAPTLTPTRVISLGTMKQITTGLAHACALSEDNRVYCWGDDSDGIVSGTASATPHPTPAEVKGFPAPVAKLAAIANDECAILTNGELWCWGANQYGQCAVAGTSGGTPPKSVPKPTKAMADAVQVGSADDSICVLRSAGEVHCFGWNGSGQLGRDNMDTNAHPESAPVVGLVAKVAQMAPGNGYHVGVALEDGRVQAWGSNARRSIVQSDTVYQVLKPTVVEGVAGAAEIATGAYFGCVRSSAGKVICWGDDSVGQVGVPAPEAGSPQGMAPREIDGITGAKRIAAGRSGHVCAVTASQLLCWGENNKGQLGRGATGTYDPKPAPVKF